MRKPFPRLLEENSGYRQSRINPSQHLLKKKQVALCRPDLEIHCTSLVPFLYGSCTNTCKDIQSDILHMPKPAYNFHLSILEWADKISNLKSHFFKVRPVDQQYQNHLGAHQKWEPTGPTPSLSNLLPSFSYSTWSVTYKWHLCLTAF